MIKFNDPSDIMALVAKKPKASTSEKLPVVWEWVELVRERIDDINRQLNLAKKRPRSDAYYCSRIGCNKAQFSHLVRAEMGHAKRPACSRFVGPLSLELGIPVPRAVLETDRMRAWLRIFETLNREDPERLERIIDAILQASDDLA